MYVKSLMAATQGILRGKSLSNHHAETPHIEQFAAAACTVLPLGRRHAPAWHSTGEKGCHIARHGGSNSAIKIGEATSH